MTAQPVEPLPAAELLDDDVADQLGRINGAVIERLLREGQPLPEQLIARSP